MMNRKGHKDYRALLFSWRSSRALRFKKTIVENKL